MNSWFDLRSLDPNDPEDKEGIENATKIIHQTIGEQEGLGIPHERIMLGGFSQGGALSLFAALKYPKKLAGVVALSCWLPLHQEFPEASSKVNNGIPVLQCHGTDDFVVPLVWGQASNAVLSTFLDPKNYKFIEYPGLGHCSSGAEMGDVAKFIKENLP